MLQKHQLPMLATYSRIVLAPIVFGCLFIESHWAGWVAGGLFILGSITDWLDGYWARLYKVESNLGKFMDPIADKILVLAALVALLHFDRVDPVMVALLLSRDIFIGGLRSVAAADQIIIAAKPSGKWKTGVQMVAIPCLLINETVFNLPIPQVGYWVLWVSVVLSIISGTEYTVGYFKGSKILSRQKDQL